MTIRVFSSATSQQLTNLKIANTVAFLDDLGTSGHLNAPISLQAVYVTGFIRSH